VVGWWVVPQICRNAGELAVVRNQQLSSRSWGLDWPGKAKKKKKIGQACGAGVRKWAGWGWVQD
jgi:hypothetical protein